MPNPRTQAVIIITNNILLSDTTIDRSLIIVGNLTWILDLKIDSWRNHCRPKYPATKTVTFGTEVCVVEVTLKE